MRGVVRTVLVFYHTGEFRCISGLFHFILFHFILFYLPLFVSILLQNAPCAIFVTRSSYESIDGAIFLLLQYKSLHVGIWFHFYFHSQFFCLNTNLNFNLYVDCLAGH